MFGKQKTAASSMSDDEQFFSDEEWDGLSDHDRFFADKTPASTESNSDSTDSSEDTPPTPRPNPFTGKSLTEPQVVYTCTNSLQAALAKSMLMSADIKFFTKGEHLSNKFGWGEVGFNPITGGISIFVAAEDAEDAFDILSTLY